MLTAENTKGSRAGTIRIRGNAVSVVVLGDGRMYRELVGREWPDVLYHGRLNGAPMGLKEYHDDGAVAEQLAQVDRARAGIAAPPQPYPKAEQAARSPRGKSRKPVRGLAPAT